MTAQEHVDRFNAAVHGGTGTMTIRRAADGLITALTVAFD
jgi:hypothetical protein